MTRKSQEPGRTSTAEGGWGWGRASVRGFCYQRTQHGTACAPAASAGRWAEEASLRLPACESQSPGHQLLAPAPARQKVSAAVEVGSTGHYSHARRWGEGGGRW